MIWWFIFCNYEDISNVMITFPSWLYWQISKVFFFQMYNNVTSTILCCVSVQVVITSSAVCPPATQATSTRPALLTPRQERAGPSTGSHDCFGLTSPRAGCDPCCCQARRAPEDLLMFQSLAVLIKPSHPTVPGMGSPARTLLRLREF